MGHWCKMDKLRGHICFPPALTRPPGFSFCIWCTWMKLNGVNVGCPPCYLVLSSHISALHSAHKVYLSKQTLCSHLVKCVQENRKWYYLVPVLVFNLLLILLPPCTVLFFLSSVLSTCFLCASSLNPLPLFYFKPCPLWCTSQRGLFVLLFYLGLLPCQRDQANRTANYVVIQIYFFPSRGCFLLRLNQSICWHVTIITLVCPNTDWFGLKQAGCEA